MDKVLVVEDTDSLREILAIVLEREGYQVDTVPSAEAALDSIRKNSYVCVLSDYRLPGKSGIEFLKEARGSGTTVPLVMMTAYGSIDIAVEAMKHGANDFITKPFEPSSLCQIIGDVITHRQIINRQSGKGTRRGRTFHTSNPETLEILEQARRAAFADTSILILGESGTGKELLARYIHEQSPRKDLPFVAVNCAAMPANLLESEFFGHEAGAFTGATQKRIGVLEYAAEGTVFLDEVGEMPPQLQVKLLRALQEREIRRVGGNKSIKINPRILAATNRNIETSLADGQLREDFYYRLAVITLNLPPLRDRLEDIPLLANYFVNYFSETNGKSLTLNQDVLQLLQTYSWPGNARELENAIERAVILADGEIKVADLELKQSGQKDAVQIASISLPEVSESAARQAEIALIQQTLLRTAGNKTRAAELLGVSYKTLLNKVKEYQLNEGKHAPI